MSSQCHHRRSVLCVVPPYMLEEIVRNGRAEDRDWALRALGIDTALRNARVTEQVLRAVAPSGSAGAAAPHRQRVIYTANDGTSLPGVLRRSEGGPATNDAACDEAYVGLGATFDLFWEKFQRNSIDGAGMNLLGTVHYGQSYDNAFWNGQQMVFGDGDGQYFNRFTAAIDVMGHELTHGVTGHEANLVYQGQSGALNESISDVFGSLVKQYAHAPQQTAAQADWLIGAGLFTARVKGVALRSMKAPGTAYDDPVLGKDPQPADMAHYVSTTADNGGVHINSGIPNRAFYLTAVALGGYAWEKAGHVWYATLCDSRLQPTAQFKDFAQLTVDNAAKLFGNAEADAVAAAWRQVGIELAAPGPQRVSGSWVLHFSWGPTSNYSQTNVVFNGDGSFGGAATGKWQQQDGTILLSFDTGPAKYGGTVDANVGSGAMSTFAGLNGCWYLTKQGTTGLTAQLAPSTAAIDVAGNPTGAAASDAGQQGHDAGGTPLTGARAQAQRYDPAGNPVA